MQKNISLVMNNYIIKSRIRDILLMLTSRNVVENI